jgi:hypothetical protein
LLDTGGVFLRRNLLLVVFVLSDLHILRLGVVEVKSLSSHLRVELEVISPLVTDGGYKVGKPVAHDGAPSNAALAPIVEEEHIILALGLVREVVIIVRGRDNL